MVLSAAELARRHIRRSQYVACDDAFIDVRLPGSTPKENYSIIGPGVTQNASQFVNLREAHGFNIGAAGLVPGITNNLHLHFTAEVFIACEGRFLLRWGAAGDEGEALLEEGDVICMPPWMFRGFSSLGPRKGFLMTVLGGDDTGGILWSPEVLLRARATGLWLGRDNQMIEVPADAPPPPQDTLMPPLPPAEVAALRRWSAAELLGRGLKPAQRDFRSATIDTALPGHSWELAPFVGWGLSALLGHRPVVPEPQGFSIEWLRVHPGQSSATFVLDEPAALVHARGPLTVEFNGSTGSTVRAELGAWDTLSLPATCSRRLINTGSEPAEALLVIKGDAPKRPCFEPALVAAARAHGLTLDAGGHLARPSLLPPPMVV